MSSLSDPLTGWRHKIQLSDNSGDSDMFYSHDTGIEPLTDKRTLLNSKRLVGATVDAHLENEAKRMKCVGTPSSQALMEYLFP